MEHFIIYGNQKFLKKKYKVEKEIEDDFITHYQDIISTKSYYIKAAKQLKTKNFKNSLCDGLLFVWENPSTPLIYITEFERETHSIEKHILPQIGDFISFIQRDYKEDILQLKKFIYDRLSESKDVFKKIQRDTDKEVSILIENALEDLQVLLVIDHFKPELSIGLSYIEKAINLKIRKIELRRFENPKGNKIISYSDSERIATENLSTEHKEVEDSESYSIEYHTKDKPENIQKIVNYFVKSTKETKTIKIVAWKQYIGFYKNNRMIFSIVVRKKNVLFYSKKLISTQDLNLFKELSFRNVSKIGHFTQHLPTEINVSKYANLVQLVEYFKTIG